MGCFRWFVIPSAVVLRMLYVEDLRELQTDCNGIMVTVQVSRLLALLAVDAFVCPHPSLPASPDSRSILERHY